MTKASFFLVATMNAALCGTAHSSPLQDVVDTCAVRAFSAEAAVRSLAENGWREIDPLSDFRIVEIISDGDLAERLSWPALSNPLQERERILQQKLDGLDQREAGQGSYMVLGSPIDTLVIVWHPESSEQGLSCILYTGASAESAELAASLSAVGGSQQSDFSSKSWKEFKGAGGRLRNVQIDVTILKTQIYESHFGRPPFATLKVMTIRWPKGRNT